MTELRKPYPQRTVELRTALVGGGNPAALYAIKRLFLASEIFSKQDFLVISTILVRRAHERMSRSALASAEYSQQSERVRGGLKAKIFGILARLEIEAKRLLLPQNVPPLLLAVQEHQFSAFSREELEAMYPDGVYLFIPDVFPKESAIQIIKEKGIIPIVWNQDANAQLEGMGLHPMLVAPILPFAYHHDGLSGKEKLPPPEDYVLIKSSGSGMPEEYARSLEQACKENTLRYQIWNPDKYFDSADQQYHPIAGSFEDKISTFYAHLFAHPPKMLISYPSEMVQVASMMPETKFVTLPTRGVHEQANLDWATAHGVAMGSLKAVDLPEIHAVLRSVWDSDTPRDFSGLGLGSIGLVDALEAQLQNRTRCVRQ